MLTSRKVRSEVYGSSVLFITFPSSVQIKKLKKLFLTKMHYEVYNLLRRRIYNVKRMGSGVNRVTPL